MSTVPSFLPSLLPTDIPESGVPRAPDSHYLALAVFGLQAGKYNSGNCIEESSKRPLEPCASWEGGSR